MPYRDQPRWLTHNAPHRGREGKAYRDACAIVRERVRLGARCWFWRRPGHELCPGRIDLRLPGNHRFAFTAHHKHRVMDGGAAVVHADDLAPAHRACNARDGLIRQNQVRAAQRARGAVPTRTRVRGVRTQGGQRGGVSQWVMNEGRGRDRQSRVW